MDDLDLLCKIYNLPKIEKEDITEAEYNHRCKYLGLYIRLIKRCQSMTNEELSGYCEVHHIQPKCLGGTDIKVNLVKMPVRYHIMSHIVIVEAYPNHRGLRYALLMTTTGGRNKNSQLYDKEGLKTFSTRLLAKVRENSIIKLRELGWTEEHREKLSKARKGKKLPKEVVEKISKSNKGKKRSEETLRKMSEVQKKSSFWRGKKLPEETKRKMSESRKNNKYYTKEVREKLRDSFLGEKNVNAKKVISPEGKIYGTILEASKKENISYNRLSNMLRGITKNNGWSYYKE